MDDNVRRYVLAYPDMSLWYSKDGDIENIRLHMDGAEGRVVPPILEHSDWSDSYYVSVAAHAECAELSRLGVTPTCVYNAFIEKGESYETYGRVSRAAGLLGSTQLPLGVLCQLVEMDAAIQEGTALLRDFNENKVLIRGLPVPVVAPFNKYLDQENCLDPSVNVAILVPWLEVGGAQLEAYWLYKGAESLGLTPIIIILDKSAVTPFFAEASLRILDVPKLVEEQLGVTYSVVPIESKMHLLNTILERANFPIIHLINSLVGYKLFSSPRWGKRYLDNRRLLVSAFCPQMDGYFRCFPKLDCVVAAYVLDSQWCAEEIGKLYGIEEERRPVMRFPVLPRAGNQMEVPKQKGDRVLWASRLDFQKNPRIVFDIARAMPDLSFDMYGAEVLNDLQMEWSEAPKNVTYRGKFFAFAELPVEKYGIFLYTSTFDGMPNILLEAALAGLPIVSSPVGGVPDFLSDGAGAIVQRHDDVEGYVRHLRAIREDQELASSFATEAYRRVTEKRSFDSFVSELSKIGLYEKMISATTASG